jgi:hypothetical protein
MKSVLVGAEDDLPRGVRMHFRAVSNPNEVFLIAARTEYRMNPDIPYAWLLVSTDRLMLCSSHKTRGVHCNLLWRQASEIRIFEATRQIDVFPHDPHRGDLHLLISSLDDEGISKLAEAILSAKNAATSSQYPAT